MDCPPRIRRGLSERYRWWLRVDPRLPRVVGRTPRRTRSLIPASRLDWKRTRLLFVDRSSRLDQTVVEPGFNLRPVHPSPDKDEFGPRLVVAPLADRPGLYDVTGAVHPDHVLAARDVTDALCANHAVGSLDESLGQRVGIERSLA